MKLWDNDEAIQMAWAEYRAIMTGTGQKGLFNANIPSSNITSVCCAENSTRVYVRYQSGSVYLFEDTRDNPREVDGWLASWVMLAIEEGSSVTKLLNRLEQAGGVVSVCVKA